MDEPLEIFLLAGQSNMAGRGRLDEVGALRDPKIFMFRGGRWITAEEPLHTDKPASAGIGLGMSFAMELLRNDQKPIGLVPCAVGGTPLSRWMPGADLYENALAVTLRALPQGRLAGILWHQGEGDCKNEDDAAGYGRRLRQMISRLRAELSAPETPVIAGELGSFLKDYPGLNHFSAVNRQLRELEKILPLYACASSGGLTDIGDSLHFDSKSLREFGCRYAEKYFTLRT